MLSSRLFWKLFAPFAGLTLVSAAVLVVILSDHGREIVIARVQERLLDSAVILRDAMVLEPDSESPAFQRPPSELQATLKRLGRQTGTRMTIVAEDGTVLGDSDEDPDVMDNHRDREELLDARSEGIGVSQRPSPTLSIPMMYVAVRVGPPEKPEGFVRIAMSMTSVDRQVASLRRLILGTAAVVSLAVLAVTYVFVGRIVRPLATLTGAARAISEGDLEQEVGVPGRDEVGTLAEAFNSMSRQLAARIGELREQGRALAENNERLQTVLEGMIEGVLAVDERERVLFANHAAGALLEFTTPDVVGRPIWEAVRNPTIQQVVREALCTPQQQRLELKLPRTQSVVELFAARLPGEPCPGIVLVMYDVTELRRLENIRQQFVSNVSHELKTPLTSIQAYTETLAAGAIDDPQHNREFLGRIEEQADRLHALILDLLRLARIESGADVFEVQPVRVAEVVHACANQQAKVAETKGIRLTTHPPASPVTVLADAEGLQTIVENLIENAILYTLEGGEVDVRWRAENSTALLEVQDTGVGIAREHQSRIFERFYRADRARSRELGGTGLGLSIVKHLVQEFGGSVEVASELGKGSTFTVRLPLAK